ncbi:hypothetical protein JCM3775_001009 [Rhodotorula graminis]
MGRASKPTEADEALSKQSLKAAVWYTVTKIAQEEELSLPFAASEHFVASLAEVVFQQALTLGKDLERFAKHAGRLTINADDVKLAARRNEPLYELLTTSAQQHGLSLAELKADTTSSKAKGGKQVKAPRLAAPKKEVARDAETSKAKDKGKEKEKGSKAQSSGKDKAKASRKGKEKARDVDEDDLIEDDVDELELEASEPEVDLDVGGGGFVKASMLKAPKTKPGKGGAKAKGKGRAVLVDSDDEEDEDEAREEDGSDDVGGSSGDESEEVGSKRRKGGKGESRGSGKKRRT